MSESVILVETTDRQRIATILTQMAAMIFAIDQIIGKLEKIQKDLDEIRIKQR